MEKLNRNFVRMVFVLILASITIAAAKHKLLIIRTAGENFEESRNGLSYELEADFEIIDFTIDKTFSPEQIGAKMTEVNPQVVVLMNNTSVSLYKKYQATLPNESLKIPTVSLMAILVNEAIEGLENATGIGYEIPIVTSSVNLRSIFGAEKIKKIGIVHRASFSEFVETNRKFCKNENIELATLVLENEGIDGKLQGALESVIKQGANALWVPGDNKLVNKELLTSVWIPFIQKNKVPIIVGVKNLVDPKFSFGTYAVLPDHSALGSQAASMVNDIMNNSWVVEENGATQPPLSVYTILNLPVARDKFGITTEQLDGVDQLLE